MTKWYCVTSAYYEDGRIVAAVTETTEAAKKPSNSVELHDSKQVWVDWFESLEEAELFMESILKDDHE